MSVEKATNFRASCLVRGALGDDPEVEVPDLTVPDDLEGLILGRDGIEDTAIVGSGHGHFTVRQHLRRLGASFPPDHVTLDRCRAWLEGAVDALPSSAEHVRRPCRPARRRRRSGRTRDSPSGSFAHAALARELTAVSKKSAMVFGALLPASSRTCRRHRSSTRRSFAHGAVVAGFPAGNRPCSRGGAVRRRRQNRVVDFGSSRPSSQPRIASESSTSTRSQVTLPASTCAFTSARPPL